MKMASVKFIALMPCAVRLAVCVAPTIIPRLLPHLKVLGLNLVPRGAKIRPCFFGAMGLQWTQEHIAAVSWDFHGSFLCATMPSGQILAKPDAQNVAFWHRKTHKHSC